MNAHERAVRIAARWTAPSMRAIRLEEWRADLRDCEGIGIDPHVVATAAIRYVVSSTNLRKSLRDFRSVSRVVAAARTGIELAVAVAWAVVSAAVIVTFVVHLSTAGNNLGFSLPVGPVISLVPGFLAVGLLSLLASLGYVARILRSRYVKRARWH